MLIKSLYWLKSKTAHRDTLPAQISFDGHVVWYQNDKEYRPSVDLPSSYSINGIMWYVRRGFMHRTTGPALIVINAMEEYWVDGDIMNPLEWMVQYGSQNN